MPNAESYKRAPNSRFNALEYFPARIASKKTTAIEAKKDGSGIAGATDLKTGKVCIPVENNSYARAVRRHESLHVLYSPASDNPKDYEILGQAVEDARLYMHENNLGLTPIGSARRDDLTAAITDLKRGSNGDKSLAALLALRSAAILQSRTDGEDESKHWPRAAKHLSKVCDSVAPEYGEVVLQALADIKAGNIGAAKDKLSPYLVHDSSKARAMSYFPNGKGETGEGTPGKVVLECKAFKADKLDGKLSTEAADMMSAAEQEALATKSVPTMNVIDLYAADNIPTYFGESHKHTQCGSKIDAKKLACTVGPATPSIFLRSIHRNGGTVVIDASGSMDIGAKTLLELCTLAPMASVAFYNGLSDSGKPNIGNLWIFAIKGRRAHDLSLVKDGGSCIEYVLVDGKYKAIQKPGWETCMGGGNLVDFQAIQWALSQPAPRYFLTDGDFTGPTRVEARSVFQTAIARKKLIQATSVAELTILLRKGKQ